MDILAWIDSRTLVTCKCLLSLVFSVVLLGIRRRYPYLRGTGPLALGFFLGVPSMLFLAARGTIPDFTSIVLANALGILCHLFLYQGILRFCHARGFQPVLYAASALAFAVLTYYSEVDPRIVPRILAASIVIGLARGLAAWELFRHAAGRLTMLLFATSLSLSSALSFLRILLTLHHGAPEDYLGRDPVLSVEQLVGVIIVMLDGFFALALLIGAVNDRAHEHAQLDYLTGSLNRRGIEDHLAVEVSRTRRTHSPIAILLIDIDKFKTINDVHGHAAGDEALRTVARSIASVLRPYDKLGRFGGDEFLLLLPETSTAAAMDIASRIRQAIQSVAPANKPPVLTLSIGVTHCDTYEEPIHILARADQALYQAKTEGRDRARSHPPTPSTIPRTHIPRTSLLSRVTARRRPSGLFY